MSCVPRDRLWHPLRRTWVCATPEEKVRIQIVHYLLQKGYSAARLRMEYTFLVGNKKRRADIVAFDVEGRIYLVIECKAPHQALSLPAFEQIGRYLYVLAPAYYALTNGKVTYVFDFATHTPLEDFPTPR
ncbi:MAG: type I restriction enzyme HsdR N-terminal domain-containing protein [Bacteroidia bacterium]